MASYYVWSGATGAGTGANWANAFLKLEPALSGKAAGDVFYVAHDHSETTAGNVFLWPAGTAGNPNKITCVNRLGSVPPVSADRRATAQVAATGNVTVQFANGSGHYDGIIFITGNSTGASDFNMQGQAEAWTRLDNCSLRIGSTGNGRITMITNATYIEWNNTTLSFSGVGQSVLVAGSQLKWRNTPSALIGTAVPTILFIPGSVTSGDIELIGVDLSAAGSGKTIFGTTTGLNPTRHVMLDCKLNAAVTQSAVPSSFGGNEVDIIRSGASGVNYNVRRHRKSGLLVEETTIVRTGGASDGTTPIAWKIVTTANSSYSLPFECPPIAIWNDTIGSPVTATVEGIGGALPTDAECWLDVEFLGDVSSPQGSFVNDGTANLLATAANQTASSATWGGSTTAFKLAVTFTPQQKGWIYARVKCAKASTTFYIDPLVTLT